MRTFLLGLSMLAVSVPTLAADPETRSVGSVYIGWVRGDALLDVVNSPVLDDDFSVGLQWGRSFSQHWGFLWRLGYSPTQITELAGEDVGASLLFTDVSATYTLQFSNMDVYVPVGLGYASASFDRVLTAPTCPGPDCVQVDGDSGLTYHVGVGMAFPCGTNKTGWIEGRYRILDALTDSLDTALSSYEISLGYGWKY